MKGVPQLHIVYFTPSVMIFQGAFKHHIEAASIS
jgi:hypothetical protein